MDKLGKVLEILTATSIAVSLLAIAYSLLINLIK